MCTKSHLADLQNYATGCDNGDAWQPLKIENRAGCIKKCPDLEHITAGLASLIVKNVKPTINPATHIPNRVKNFANEYQGFCELQRVVDSKRLVKNAKISLISCPTKKSALRFLRTTFKAFEVTAEMAVFMWILILRLSVTAEWELRATTWRSILMVALKIAQVHEGHYTLSNKTISGLYSLFSEKEYLDLSLDFLRILDYRCYVPADQFVATYELLLRRGLATSP